MSCEQTLAGSGQNVKKSRIAKVHFILKKVKNSPFGKSSNFKFQLKFKGKKRVIKEGVLYWKKGEKTRIY